MCCNYDYLCYVDTRLHYASHIFKLAYREAKGNYAQQIIYSSLIGWRRETRGNPIGSPYRLGRKAANTSRGHKNKNLHCSPIL